MYSSSPLGIEKFSDYYYGNSPEQSILKIFKTDKLFVMDACTIHYLILSQETENFAKIVNEENGSIIIFRTIIMELGGERGVLDEKIDSFFESFSKQGVFVCILYEEELFDILKGAYNDNATINHFLCKAIKYNLDGRWLEEKVCDSVLKDVVIYEKRIKSVDLYHNMFLKIRSNKMPGDDLGEEVCLVCLYLLSCLPYQKDERYIFCTDDKKAMVKYQKVRTNILTHESGRRIGLFSYVYLIQREVDSGIIQTEEQLKKALNMRISDGKICVYGLYKYSTEIEEIKLPVETFVKRVIKNEIQMRV